MRLAPEFPATSTRVERETSSDVNELIRLRTDATVARLQRGDPIEIKARLAELDHEWDIERVLQANASTLALLGTLLGLTVDRRFFLLPTGVLSFFLQHALQGWCPPIPLFRRRGIRTAREIERERYAIKLLRGDFDRIPRHGRADTEARVRAVLDAIDA
jgi:hypothetical protein